MTTTPASSPAFEPLEAFPIPEDAIVLPAEVWREEQVLSSQPREWRRLALAALGQAMKERHLNLPLGPETDPTDPSRLLSLNRFAVQLAVTGLLSDQLTFGAAPWRDSATAPQLLLVAAIDDDSGIVHFPGVLTATEVVAAIGRTDPAADELMLPLATFPGGVERLFTLTALLDPAALPRQTLTPAAQPSALVRVRDWLEGLMPPPLADLGAELVPLTAAAFRGGGLTADTPIPGALAVLSIPLGLTNAGELEWGEAARRCIERFQLLLIPITEPTGGDDLSPERLTLRLIGELEGDLLPDGLELLAVQGSRRLSIRSNTSTSLELELPAAPELIEVTLTPPGGRSLLLPPLQLPGG
ncbi:hypothetical protein [Cyanobium sp. LEGE 06113]|uniref:hypothetical protein n=1 Tax=Cyanobium sp. LEGE 06113 TaxID=1297573 RepID=UPI00187E662C|nr:hypothetical protein [Cyanobium sp. LEGE 06113]MBE9153316.1 hypothetical protein [Cyanobium sp. LEGE 06113]